MRVAELTLQLGDDEQVVRLEVLRSSADPTRFRWRLWRLEHFRLRPSFPQDADGEPEHVADDALLADRTWILAKEECVAADVDEAFALALGELTGLVERTSG